MSRGVKWLIGCLVGGCGGIILLAVIATVLGGLVASRYVDLNTKVSVPADFPVYPGSQQQTAIGVRPKSGDQAAAVSVVQWLVYARGDRVLPWYRDHLDKGDWEVVREDSAGITFRRRSTGAEGMLQVRDQIAQSVVQLAMSGDQPLERGAHPVPRESATP